MRPLFRAAPLALALTASAAAVRAQQPMQAAPLGIPHTRMGSGTSWIPDASPIRQYTGMAGPWMLNGRTRWEAPTGSC